MNITERYSAMLIYQRLLADLLAYAVFLGVSYAAMLVFLLS